MALLRISFIDRLGSRLKKRRSLWLAVLVLSSLLGAKTWAQTELGEYQLKAVFLFNFAQFVEWPASAFENEESPLVIGVLGDDPFDGMLDSTIHGEKIGGRSLIVHRYRRVEEIGICHILFISKSESSRLESTLSALGGRSMLTVSDADRAAQRGVMIWLVTEKKRIRLRINVGAAKLAGLTISSKLLRPAEIVATGQN